MKNEVKQGRSFTEYVKLNMDNQMWKAMEDFITESDPSQLDMRTSRVRNIGEIIELYDTDLKFVDVSDLPGSMIAFDVVMEASIIVSDADRYHNDESALFHQWFKIQCQGDLERRLEDLEILGVSVYDCRTRRAHPMSNGLVPIISKEDLDSVADDFLRKYYGEVLQQPMMVDPMELARRMGLTVIFHRISEDMSIFGQIYFRETDARLYDEDLGAEVEIHVMPGTVVVDPSVAFQRNLGAYNNTIVHECLHWALHRKAFALEQLFNSDAGQIRCRVIGGVEGHGNDEIRWMEWQANSLAPRIQMPLAMFRRQASAAIRKYRDQLGVFELCEVMQPVIEDLAAFFSVSRTAAKLRMIDAGFEEAAGAFIYIDGQYVRPHTFRKDAIRNDQTYSIPARDAAILCLTSEKLAGATHYVYIESHFVLAHPRYVCRNEYGETVLTDYARYHMDECCLAFDLSIRGNVEEHYHRECILNRDKGSPINFDIVYKGENGELSDEERNRLIDDEVNEESELLKDLTNNYTEAWRKVLKWRGISQAELARRTGLAEKTIGNVINTETAGSINTVVLMCLGAHLPWDISNYLMERCGQRLVLSNNDHQWYRFVLQKLYPKSIPEIQKFLQLHGAKPL